MGQATPQQQAIVIQKSPPPPVKREIMGMDAAVFASIAGAVVVVLLPMIVHPIRRGFIKILSWPFRGWNTRDG